MTVSRALDLQAVGGCMERNATACKKSTGVRVAVTHWMPMPELTVMIYHPEEDEPVWLGYLDGKTWRTVEVAEIAQQKRQRRARA